jgi:hypothetical protein
MELNGIKSDGINSGILKVYATFATIKNAQMPLFELTNFSGSTKPARPRRTLLATSDFLA